MFSKYLRVFYIILIIFILLNLVLPLPLCQPPPPPPPPTIGGGGSGHPTANLFLNLSSDVPNASRGCPARINYNMTYWGGTSDEEKEITICIPKEFSNAASIECNPYKISKIENTEIDILIPGTDASEKNYISLSYIAEISMNANVGPLEIDPKKDAYVKRNGFGGRYYPGNSCIITIENNIPNITKFYPIEYGEYPNSETLSLFKDDEVNFSCEGSDDENNILIWSLWDICSNNKTHIDSIENYSGSVIFHYKASNPGKHEIELKLIDIEGDNDTYSYPLNVDKLSKSENISRIYSKYTRIIIAISFVFLYIRRKFKKQYIPILAIISLPILWLVVWHFEVNITVPNYELYLYTLMLIFAAYFIEANFNPEEDPIRIYPWNDWHLWGKNKIKLIKTLWQSIKDDTPQLFKNKIKLFKSNPQILEKTAKLIRYIKKIIDKYIVAKFTGPHILYRDRLLWVLTTVGMGIIINIILRYLPVTDLFASPDSEQLHNYMFTYYAANLGAFGVILAIIVSFAIWYLETQKIHIDPRIYKRTVMNFTSLYILLILLSVLGLVIGTIPVLDVTKNVSSIPVAISILTFECTLLLIVPAFLCLYEFANWIMGMAIFDIEPISSDLMKEFEKELEEIKKLNYRTEEEIKKEMRIE